MKKFSVLFIVCILIFMATWSYSVSQTPKEDVALITINAAMSSKPIPITVTRGTEFTVNLASNPTTGYSWALKEGYDKKIVQSSGSNFNPPSEQIPGRGGSETWTFKSVGQGKTNITLNYARPWEKDVEPIKSQTFAVTVQ